MVTLDSIAAGNMLIQRKITIALLEFLSMRKVSFN